MTVAPEEEEDNEEYTASVSESDVAREGEEEEEDEELEEEEEEEAVSSGASFYSADMDLLKDDVIEDLDASQAILLGKGAFGRIYQVSG